MIYKFLQEVKLPGYLIFGKVWGSYSHNTNLPESDVDYLAVYASPTKDVLSLRPPAETIDHKAPDWQAHEIKKFCQLLIKGNPGVIEMLFTNKMCYETGEWRELRQERSKFLTHGVVKNYLGYMSGQLNKLQNGAYLKTTGGEYNTKWAYHTIRLGMDAHRIAAGGEPLVWKEGHEQELLMKIRRRGLVQNEVVEMANNLVAKIESLKPWAIRESPDEDFLNSWLLSIRNGH